VNGKNILDYFYIPRQRWLVLKPLVLTKYTCLLDVELWVHGGGCVAQANACIPAISKAIQKFDVSTRKVIKASKCSDFIV
jgi:ribosomal protein S9